MIRTVLLLLVACSAGCSLANAPITITEGRAAEFANVRRVCIYGSDANTNINVEELIARELSARLPGIITPRPCGENEMQIIIQYQSGLSACTHCPPPYTGPRFAFAFIQARNGCDIRAEGEWSWQNGGSAARLARRFAASLAQFLETTTAPSASLADSQFRVYHHANGQVAAEGHVTSHESVAFLMAKAEGRPLRPWQQYLRVGKWRYFDESGRVRAELSYRLASYTDCCTAGLCEQPYEMLSGTVRTYASDGAVTYDGTPRNGARVLATNCEGGDVVYVSMLPLSPDLLPAFVQSFAGE